MEEEWRDIEGFEGLYQVSNLGRVKSLDKWVQNHSKMQHRPERILRANYSNASHVTVVLCKEGKTYPNLVHRLVAKAFIPNPDGKPVVDHIDTNPANNQVDNLRWCTQKENCNNPLSRLNNSKAKMGHPYRGRPLTAEERKKISVALTGRKASEELKRKLSEIHKTSEACIRQAKKLSTINSGKHWKLEGGKRVWY